MSVGAKGFRPQFDLYFGIDQTGAAKHGGLRAKPLPCAVLQVLPDNEIVLHLHSSVDGSKLNLESFNQSCLQNVLTQCGLNGDLLMRDRTGIFLDCVFGLPSATWPGGPGLQSLWNLFSGAHSFPGGYGLQPAANYFARILARSAVDISETANKKYPVRNCEILANANSVFRTHPFQKNIQCGTYRIWRDLGATAHPWINIRHFTPSRAVSADLPWLFESYPSLFWRTLFGQRTRNLQNLREAVTTALPNLRLNKIDWALLAHDPDIADAAVLALGGYLLASRGALSQRRADRRAWLAREGWIVGLAGLRG